MKPGLIYPSEEVADDAISKWEEKVFCPRTKQEEQKAWLSLEVVDVLIVPKVEVGKGRQSHET